MFPAKVTSSLPEPALKPPAWTSAVSPNWSPSLCLSKPSACCHHCSQINLLNTPLWTSPLSAPEASMAACGQRQVQPELCSGSFCLALPTLPPCSLPTPPLSDPGRPFHSWSPGCHVHSLLALHLGSHCPQLGMPSTGSPASTSSLAH